MTSSSSEPSSTSSSPTLHGQRSSLPQIHAPIYALPKPAQNKKQSTQHQTTMSSIPEDASLTSDDFGRRSSQSISQDEAQLFDINYDIKSTLTDLLNCEAVRNDPKMRIWVQSRLMDAELELKRQRKRTLSAPSIVVSESEELDRRASVA
ncbi:hypothetical protein EJ03DRAFT_326567 [Teratosphaeria nubilosa]|uniref:Uncharacterized protein n=1 Tax=Teratosphaeria nubilosa TaxID=161662 RepID=A0A6G1LCX5_9PEZI|nr:hypothetical protein EJ03DRAFT_326567 [Teratosphaeria nubilosa]